MFNSIDFLKTPLNIIYGQNLFSDSAMRERLPKSIYQEIRMVQAGKTELSPAVAEVVANAMKDWAIEKGATHYTHWFQPLTGLTAEKHDSFISPTADGKVIMEFSGKELIRGEPDASSFPSGGLRSTFEARGYTAWDTTSPAFLKEDNTGVTLYIPTAFVSYNGQALDKKVPLLRSMEALNSQALRVLRTLGNTTVKNVVSTVGPEQEYFLIDKEYAERRPDILLTGRTVFGKPSSKGQEMGDHYFGPIMERIRDFMRELNFELWKLGIAAKTQHKEVAPNQFELATIFDTVNLATDRNQLVMDTLRRVATRHRLIALLHEKPFAGVNGSGKHNNWSMATDSGDNLLEPGDNPYENAQFLLFLSAVIKAVDLYAPLIRAAASNSGNDLRLGAAEAPPAIISIFLGDQLTEVLDTLAEGRTVKASNGSSLEIGITTLPKLPKDLTDRNRTSPFAFTGNKFEFRMVPSSHSIAGPNTVINTAVAEVLSGFADILEKSTNVNTTIGEIIRNTYRDHKRIVFNGNGYSEEWRKEAEGRKLPNIATTVEALPEFIKDYSIDLFGKHHVYSGEELESRYSIYLENYIMQIHIEASIMLEMAQRSIYPAALSYAKELSGSINEIEKALKAPSPDCMHQRLKILTDLIRDLCVHTDDLSTVLCSVEKEKGDCFGTASRFRTEIIPRMEVLRKTVDGLEEHVPRSSWPFPGYEEMLFHL